MCLTIAPLGLSHSYHFSFYGVNNTEGMDGECSRNKATSTDLVEQVCVSGFADVGWGFARGMVN